MPYAPTAMDRTNRDPASMMVLVVQKAISGVLLRIALENIACTRMMTSSAKQYH